VSGSEEETYSAMFSSLKHPVRRKILKMLSENPMTFSQMVEELGIPGSHLTYHLENLGEFIAKTEDGKYKLSGIGDSTVSIMKGAEEVPSVQAKKFSTLPFRWKTILAVFIIGTVFLAGMAGVQYAYFNQLSNDYQVLKVDYELLKAQSQQMPWSSAERAMIIIRDVVQIDTTKYQVTLLSDTVENRSELGGMPEEIQKYSLKSEGSNIDLVLRFRNNHLSLYQLSLIQGIPPFAPLYIQPQATNTMEAAKNLIDRYRTSSGESYLEEINTLLSTAPETSSEQTLGTVKMKTTVYLDNVVILFTYNSNGYPFSAKSLRMQFEDHVLKEMSDDWFLFKISNNATVNINEEQAIQIARNAAQNYEWTANGQTISDFTILQEPSSAVFYPHPRNERLTLVPYWYITLYLDKEYPVQVNSITVGVWADTGEVANIQTLNSK
jgi:hypothetical protein